MNYAILFGPKNGGNLELIPFFSIRRDPQLPINKDTYFYQFPGTIVIHVLPIIIHWFDQSHATGE